MAKLGRKSKFEELEIAHRYAELSDKYFAVLNEFLNGKDKNDKRFAVEQLSKAFPKMIPQQIGGLNGAPIAVQWIQSQSSTNQESGQTPSTTV